jgi:hypothetical protein
VCFAGDVVHTPVHVLRPEWSLDPGPGANYDHEAAASSRRRVLEHCATTGHLLAPAHFQAPHACRIERATGGHYRLSWAVENRVRVRQTEEDMVERLPGLVMSQMPEVVRKRSL